MQWHLLLIVPLLILPFADGEEGKWTIHCPNECSCLLSYLKDLPMRKWLTEESTGQKSHSQETYEYNNEAMYAEDAISTTNSNEANEIVRMAICVLHKDSHPEDLMQSLPSNLEVLTLLQSPDSDLVTLGDNIFHNLPDLLALEIQGFHGHGSTQVSGHHSNKVQWQYPLDNIDTDENIIQPQEKIALKMEAIQPLHSLQYLNLQYVKLIGSGGKFSDGIRLFPTKVASFKYEVDNPELEYQESDQDGLAPHQLVFLSPEPEDIVIPYKLYRQEQDNTVIFMGLPNLVFLRLYACGLKEVHWEMFDGLPQLEYLSLEGNSLKFIPEFTFYGAPNLKILSLAYNKLLSLQSTSLAGLLELKKLDLSHNNFSHLSELSLPPFPHLTTADFRHNPMEAVFSSTFEIMNATEILYLGGDEIGIEVKHNSFSGLSSLLKLFIHNVIISKIERVTLTGMPKLLELEMEGLIDSIDFDAFAEVPKLEKLTLKHCHIKTVSMDAFYGAYNIHYLDLSYNDLESLPPGVFDQQRSIKELLLQYNKLKELPEGIFNQVTAKMIRLEGNPWHCSCSMMGWRETSINKVKQKISTPCQHHYDKGISCTKPAYKYVYDKRVAPQCETPAKYKNWSVFHVMRKVFRCKKTDKMNHIKRLQEKYSAKKEEIQKTNYAAIGEKKLSVKLYKQQNGNGQTLTDRTVEPLMHQNITGMEFSTQTTTTQKHTADLSHITNYVTDTTLEALTTRISSTEQPIMTNSDNITTTGNNRGENNTQHGFSVTPNSNNFEMEAVSTTKAQKMPHIASTQSNNDSKQKKLNDINNDADLVNDLMSFLQKNIRTSNNEPSNANSMTEKLSKIGMNSNISGKSNGLKKPKESILSEKEYLLFEGNRNIKVSKKAYKLEMERQAKEKQRTQ